MTVASLATHSSYIWTSRPARHSHSCNGLTIPCSLLCFSRWWEESPVGHLPEWEMMCLHTDLDAKIGYNCLPFWKDNVESDRWYAPLLHPKQPQKPLASSTMMVTPVGTFSRTFAASEQRLMPLWDEGAVLGRFCWCKIGILCHFDPQRRKRQCCFLSLASAICWRCELATLFHRDIEASINIGHIDHRSVSHLKKGPKNENLVTIVNRSTFGQYQPQWHIQMSYRTKFKGLAIPQIKIGIRANYYSLKLDKLFILPTHRQDKFICPMGGTDKRLELMESILRFLERGGRGATIQQRGSTIGAHCATSQKNKIFSSSK